LKGIALLQYRGAHNETCQSCPAIESQEDALRLALHLDVAPASDG